MVGAGFGLDLLQGLRLEHMHDAERAAAAPGRDRVQQGQKQTRVAEEGVGGKAEGVAGERAADAEEAGVVPGPVGKGFLVAKAAAPERDDAFLRRDLEALKILAHLVFADDAADEVEGVGGVVG